MARWDATLWLVLVGLAVTVSLSDLGSFKPSSNRAGNDELEDAELEEDLGLGVHHESMEPEVVKIVRKSPGGTVTCPTGKTCELQCLGRGVKGGKAYACRGIKFRGGGHFAKIACLGQFACFGDVMFQQMGSGFGGTGQFILPDCPPGKRCELKCKGTAACRGIRTRRKDGNAGWWSKISCEGNDYHEPKRNVWAHGNTCCCSILPNCPTGKRCEVVAKYGALCCSKPVSLTAPGITVDFANGGAIGGMSATMLPKVSAIPRKVKAFRAVGVNGYAWPPVNQCKDLYDRGGGLKNPKHAKWWYCPGTQKCVRSERMCETESKMRTLGKREVHDITADPPQHHIRIQLRMGKKRVSGLVHGKRCSTTVPIRVMEDALAGYQSTSAIQLGGLRSIAGTVVDVDSDQVIFSLPRRMWPNYCIRVLSPLIGGDSSVLAANVEICDAGRAEVYLPEGATTSKGTMSLANIKYVPWEVKGGDKVRSTWANAKDSYMYFHKLDMGGGVICVLSGTITTKWGSSDTMTIGQVDPACTKDYKEGYRTIANVKVDGEQQWIQKGKWVADHSVPTPAPTAAPTLAPTKEIDIPRLKCGAPACAYYYKGISGSSVGHLTRSSKFPDSPDDVKVLTGKFETRNGYGNNYGAMLEGYVKAPASGQYIFFTKSDDSSEIWVSSQPSTSQHLIKVVELRGCCREVKGSVKVSWTAGKYYYIKGLVKEGGGGDYLYVGMQLVGGSKYMPIPISMFSGGDASSPLASAQAQTDMKCGAAACAYYYKGIHGGDVASLTRAPKFPHSPDETKSLTAGNFETRNGYGNQYGAMLEGYVKAPVSGEYIFFTNSDDHSEIWVASKPSTQSSLVKVVELRGCCKEVKGSVRVSWTAGKHYYIKGLVKENGGGDYLKVGMQLVGGSKYMPIPISMFEAPDQTPRKLIGATIPFQLFLRGSELHIQTDRTDIDGKTVTVSLDGTTFASGQEPDQCRHHQSKSAVMTLGESKTAGHKAPIGTFGPGSTAGYPAPVGTFVQTSSATSATPVSTLTQDASAGYSAPVGTFGPGTTAPVNDATAIGTYANTAPAVSDSTSLEGAISPKDSLLTSLDSIMGKSSYERTQTNSNDQRNHADQVQSKQSVQPVKHNKERTPDQTNQYQQQKVVVPLSLRNDCGAAMQAQLESKRNEAMAELKAELVGMQSKYNGATSKLLKKLSTLQQDELKRTDHTRQAKARVKQLKLQKAALESKFKIMKTNAGTKLAECEVKIAELTGSTNELRAKVSAANSTQQEAIRQIKGLQMKLAHRPASSSAQHTQSSSEAQPDFDGCRLVRNKVNTTQPGFAPHSVIGPANLVVMGDDVTTQTCVLRGVVKFSSIAGDAVAFLDPNYLDPTTRMPFCFPMATMIFFANVVEPDNHHTITKTVALQIEPHGRLLLFGKHPRDLFVRLDNIMYHPLMKFNKSPSSCAPYCFPNGKEGSKGMSMAGCVKYCTPTQYVRDKAGGLHLGRCRCALLKRITCFKHSSDDPEVLSGAKEAPIICGQFKKIMSVSNPKKCSQICAGQLVAF